MENYLYISLAFLLHVLLQSKSYFAERDFDTASHIYSALLKKNKVKCHESYSYGVKWVMPYLYFLYLKHIPKNKIFDHRIINTLFGSFFLIYLILQNENSLNLFFYLFVFIIFMNSYYINFQTSATEFIDTPILLILISMCGNFDSNSTIIIFIILIIGISFLTKLINLLYLIPLSVILFFNSKFIMMFIVIFSAIVFLFILYNLSFKKIFVYSKTRNIFSKKNLKFLIFNPIFLILNFYLSYLIILSEDINKISLIITCWFILGIQKSYVGYFWYPLIMLNLFFNFQLGTKFDQILIFLILPQIAYSLYLAIYGYDYKGKNISELFFLGTGIKSILNKNSTKKNLAIINTQSINFKNVYMWGSNSNLLLTNNLLHVPNTFYNHNHLFFWSTIKNKKEYVIDYIDKNTPEIIIESETIDDFNFPIDRFKKYETIFVSEYYKIYKKKIF